MTRIRKGIPAVALAGGLVVGGGAMDHVAAAATGYTLEPLNLNLVDSTPNLFDGAVCEVYDCAKVPTPASLDLSHVDGVFGENGPISTGAATLNDVLLADPGEKLVLGFSQGAQVGGFWLRNYASTTSVDRETTSFLFVGDPENTYGVPWAPKVPTGTGFAVTEVWSQYDGWADWPARFDVVAIANAIAGMFLVHPVVYDTMDLAAEEADGNLVMWQGADGNDTGSNRTGINYTMVRNDRLPLLDPLRWVGLGAVAESLDAPLRAQIESAYDRPSTQAQADAGFDAQPTPAAARVVLPKAEKTAVRALASDPTSRRRDTAASAPSATVSPGRTPARSRLGSTAVSIRTTTAPKRARD